LSNGNVFSAAPNTRVFSVLTKSHVSAKVSVVLSAVSNGHVSQLSPTVPLSLDCLRQLRKSCLTVAASLHALPFRKAKRGRPMDSLLKCFGKMCDHHRSSQTNYQMLPTASGDVSIDRCPSRLRVL
ncbi:hypothetical protein BaRGS_00005251, partial [Batillaria attramentaria]